MTNLPQPDVALAHRLFREVHDDSVDGVGVTREAYGPGERRSHALMRREALSLGLEVAADHAGNLYLTLPGRDRTAKRILFGSHLDSVPQGGDYDGVAGVLAGLAVVAGLRRAAFVPDRDVTVLVTRAEEAGAWFPFSFPGSKAALGRLPPAALDVRRQDSGRTLRDHMAEEGFDPDACVAGLKVLGPENVAAFIEVHIEQGPVLEAEGVEIAVVTGIPGSRRYRDARVVGEYNHSGATPRAYRHDAAVALAELVYRLDAAWAALEAQGHALVCTFCVMATTEDAAFTKIAGEARFQLDMRSVRPESLDLLHAELERLAAEIARSRGVRFEFGPMTGSLEAPMDAALQGALQRSADIAGVTWRLMASGGGHDAAAFAEAGVPAAMLFIRNQNGSHNPQEAMRLADFDRACDVLMRWVFDHRM